MNNLAQFSLRWNNYVTHVTEAFNVLRLDNDLVDVTLHCDGGRIKAHKILLSACSNYFKQIFKENPCQHPVIIFRNVKYEDLNAIINFMYHGEVNIIQEQLESFLITAELLEVKGLTDNIEDEVTNNPYNESSFLDLSAKSKQNENIEDEPMNLATIQTPRSEFVSTIKPTHNYEDSVEIQQDIIKGEEPNNPSTATRIVEDTMQVDKPTTEDLSDKNSADSDLVKFRCQLCPKGFKHPTSLTLHKDSHAGKTQCPVCHRSFSRSYDMRNHLQRIHQGKQLTIKEIRYNKPNNDISTVKQFTHNI